MSASIGETTRKKLEQLSQKISVSQQLDDEIRAELLSHMEDKLSGYLDGSEMISEEDALILVREHFGDPAVIASLFQDVEDIAPGVSFFRKLAAVFAATILFIHLGPFLFEVTFVKLTLLMAKGELIFPDYVGIMAYKVIPAILTSILFFATLRTWKTGLEKGRDYWFSTLNPYILVLINVLLLIFHARIVRLLMDYQVYQQFDFMGSLGISYLIITMLSVFGWLYWFDTPRIRLITLLAASTAWYICGMLVYTAIPIFSGEVIFSFSLRLIMYELLRHATNNVRIFTGLQAAVIYLMLESLYTVRQKLSGKFSPKLREK